MTDFCTFPFSCGVEEALINFSTKSRRKTTSFTVHFHLISEEVALKKIKNIYVFCIFMILLSNILIIFIIYFDLLFIKLLHYNTNILIFSVQTYIFIIILLNKKIKKTKLLKLVKVYYSDYKFDELNYKPHVDRIDHFLDIKNKRYHLEIF